MENRYNCYFHKHWFHVASGTHIGHHYGGYNAKCVLEDDDNHSMENELNGT